MVRIHCIRRKNANIFVQDALVNPLSLPDSVDYLFDFRTSET